MSHIQCPKNPTGPAHGRPLRVRGSDVSVHTTPGGSTQWRAMLQQKASKSSPLSAAASPPLACSCARELAYVGTQAQIR